MLARLSILLATLAAALTLTAAPATADDDHDWGCDERVLQRGGGHDDCDPPVVIPNEDLFTVIVGTPRRDWLFGTTGRDALFGLGDRDRLRGKSGNDLLFAGAGNDVLRGGRGADVLRGGPGFDRCIGDPTDQFLSCERVVMRLLGA